MANNPTGLTVTRSGDKFICRWKNSSSYVGFDFYYYYTTKSGSTTTSHKSNVITIGTTKHTVSLNHNVSVFRFYVRGIVPTRTSVTKTGWSQKDYEINPPANPVIKAEWDSATPNKTVFTYTATDSGHYPFKEIEYQYMWAENCGSDPYYLNWKSATVYSSTSLTGTIFNSAESGYNTGSHARVVRARTVGPGGYSDWVYKKHVYAQPNSAKNLQAVSARAIPETGAIEATITWTLVSTATNPVDKQTVQYVIGEPGAGMTPPNSWNDIDTPLNAKQDSWSGQIDTPLGDNQCIWFRVVTKHDNNTVASTPVLALAGKLAAPTITAFSSNAGSQTITITATNNATDAAGSFLMVRYYKDTALGPVGGIIGIINSGESTTLRVPWSGTDTLGSVCVAAAVGSYTYADITSPYNYRAYDVKADMLSDDVYAQTVTVPTITLAQADVPETVAVSWEWINDVTGLELTWSERKDAWSSTDEPNSHEVDITNTGTLNVSDIEPGVTYYFRARFMNGSGDNATYSDYSSIKEINIASEPAIPVLTIEPDMAAPDESFTASWVYVSYDDSTQANALLVIDNNGAETELAMVGSSQTITLNAEEAGLTTGTYALKVKVYSTRGMESQYSDLAYITIAPPLTCSITSTSLLMNQPVVIDPSTTIYENILDEMPLDVTVVGAGNAGTTEVVIQRTEDYVKMKPDEDDYYGYTDEIVAGVSHTGEDPFQFEFPIMGRLDDGASYKLVATVTDEYGRTATDEIPFTVYWDEQAVKAEGSALISDDVAHITVGTPAGADVDDTVDIYRLSADKPKLIVQGAEFGDEYIDPYPTMGEFGGYRLVLITKNQDYYTADEEPSWIDISVPYDRYETVITFGGNEVALYGNLKVSSDFAKDFQRTRYLGGSIRGDWKRGVERDGSADGVAVTTRDPELIKDLRRLAEWTGLCHVRTPDGSNFMADVQVSDDEGYDSAGKIYNCSLNISKVDTIELDGMLVEEES